MKETSNCQCESGCDALHYYPTMSEVEYNAYKRKVKKALEDDFREKMKGAKA
jgi:hypothetical protein